MYPSAGGRRTLANFLINQLFDQINDQKTFPNGVNIPENRLPELLRDVKVLLTDAFIADVMSDTLEVIYNLNSLRKLP